MATLSIYTQKYSIFLVENMCRKADIVDGGSIQ